MFDPDVPDFARRHRNVGRALHALNHLDEVADLLLVAEDCLVADDDTVDVAVTLRQIDDRADFTLVAIFVFVDPCAGGDPKPEFRRDARHELHATSRGIGTDRAGQRSQKLEVGTNLCSASKRAGVRMRRTFEGRIGNAGQLAAEIGGARVVAKQCPETGMHARHKGDHGSDGAHTTQNQVGQDGRPLNPSPGLSRNSVCKDAA